jgi:protein-tyrosine phosphatase
VLRLVDLHSHLLPGVDDGARSMSEALEIARAMVRDGVERVAATPHVRDDWPTTPEIMELGVAQLRAVLADEGIPLDVLPGGEISLDALPQLSPGELSQFGLGGNPRLLLLEFPYSCWPLGIADTVGRLTSSGIVPVLAHPERNPEVQRDPARLGPLVRAGAIVQLTAASVDGRLGSRPRAASRRLLDLELAHLVASDSHSPDVRGAGLAAAARSLGDEALGSWLTHDVPAALLAGDELPPRPEPATRRRLLRLRG